MQQFDTYHKTTFVQYESDYVLALTPKKTVFELLLRFIKEGDELYLSPVNVYKKDRSLLFAEGKGQTARFIRDKNAAWRVIMDNTQSILLKDAPASFWRSLLKNIRNGVPCAVLTAANEINVFLNNSDLEVSCDMQVLEDNVLGSYESGSVFEKSIKVNIDIDNVLKACEEDHTEDVYSDPANVTKMTIYHEVGHGLMEQIIDWINDIPEISSLCDGPFGDEFKEVIDDEYDEEDVVEDFAWGLFDGVPSALEKCWARLCEFIGKA